MIPTMMGVPGATPLSVVVIVPVVALSVLDEERVPQPALYTTTWDVAWGGIAFQDAAEHVCDAFVCVKVRIPEEGAVMWV